MGLAKHAGVYNSATCILNRECSCQVMRINSHCLHAIRMIPHMRYRYQSKAEWYAEQDGDDADQDSIHAVFLHVNLLLRKKLIKKVTPMATVFAISRGMPIRFLKHQK